MIPSPIDTSMTIKTDRGALLTALGLLRAYAPDEPGVGEFLASVEELAAPVWANAACCGTASVGRSVRGFEEFYEALPDGGVLSLRSGERMTPYLRKGYWAVTLRGNGKREIRSLNRLICESFHGAPLGVANEAAHLDGNLHNNAADNLAWATRQQNEAHKIGHGTSNYGGAHGQARLTDAEAAEIRARQANGETQKSLAAAFGVSKQLISDLIRGKSYAAAPVSAIRRPPTFATGDA